MRKSFASLLFVSSLLGTLAAEADGVDVTISMTEADTRDLYLASESYFGIQQSESIRIQQQGIPAAEVPVVLFLASRARVQPAAVLEQRRAGRSWSEVARHFSVRPEAFHVSIERPSGPYERAYRAYHERPRDEWDDVVLGDEDVRELVYLRFLSEHYGAAPEQIMLQRSSGEDAISVHRSLRRKLFSDARHDAEVALQLDAEDEEELYSEALGYYQVTPEEVTMVRKQGIPSAEMPVVLFTASQARVQPSAVAELRLRGLSWMEIMHRFRLDAAAYHVPLGGSSVTIAHGSPYAGIYAAYSRPRAEWDRIVLSDRDFLHLVNLRLLSQRYGYTVDHVIRLRSEGKAFTTIYRDGIVKKRAGKPKGGQAGKGKGHEKGKGKGHEKGKGKGHEKGKGKGHEKGKGKGHGKHY
jgi:hypothetical protein